MIGSYSHAVCVPIVGRVSARVTDTTVKQLTAWHQDIAQHSARGHQLQDAEEGLKQELVAAINRSIVWSQCRHLISPFSAPLASV